MLTLEENGWNFKAVKIYSVLNIFPIQLDMKTGKIHNRQSKTDKMRSFLWNLLFWVGIIHCIFMFARLLQSTILEPEKYFRWDHFIIHFAFSVGYSLNYYTGFCLFRKNPEECIIIFNQLFVERENPVQKMVDQEEEQKKQEREFQVKSEHGRERRGKNRHEF